MYDIVRSYWAIESCQISLWFGHDAFPAALVEPERDIVGNRVAGSDVNIEAGLLSLEGQRQMVVFQILRIRQRHDGSPLQANCVLPSSRLRLGKRGQLEQSTIWTNLAPLQWACCN